MADNILNFNNLSDRAKEALANASNRDAKGFFINRILFGAPALGSTTGLSVGIAFPSLPTTMVGFTNPDVPRFITVKGSASPFTGTLTFIGKDFDNQPITEDIALSHLATVESVRAFSTVQSVSFPTQVQSGTVFLGTSDKLGLNAPAADNSTILGLVDGTRETTAPVIVGNDAINRNGVTFTTALDGAKIFTLYYIAKATT